VIGKQELTRRFFDQSDMCGWALFLAEKIDQVAPDCREKSLAVTHLEEAVFWANAAVARPGVAASRDVWVSSLADPPSLPAA